MVLARVRLGPRAMVTVALAAGMVAAACTGNAAQGEAAAPAAGEKVVEELNEIDAVLGSLQVDPFRPATTRAVFLPDPPQGQVTVKLDFPEYQNALPGRMEVHLPKGPTDRLWFTQSVPAGKRLPVGPEIDDGILFVDPGEMGLVTLVYRNPTDRAIRIRTVAPFIDPAVATPLAYGRCWCDAPGFDVPAKGTFYRTIGVGVAAVTPPGAKAVVTWPVIVVES